MTYFSESLTVPHLVYRVYSVGVLKNSRVFIIFKRSFYTVSGADQPRLPKSGFGSGSNSLINISGLSTNRSWIIIPEIGLQSNTPEILNSFERLIQNILFFSKKKPARYISGVKFRIPTNKKISHNI